MKKMLGLIIILFVAFGFAGCSNKTSNDYLRIHIRANSNLQIDQNVKYKVKDEVVGFLTPLIANCKNLTDVENMVEKNKTNIESVCNKVLKQNGFLYTATAKIKQEFFPTRAYGEYVLESDFYDALVIELGSGSGDNWWCVVYPPLCFLNAKEINGTNLKYKSKIYELINKFFG